MSLREHFNEKGKPKRGFQSKAGAIRFVQKHKLENILYYQCSFCGKWHIATDKRPD